MTEDPSNRKVLNKILSELRQLEHKQARISLHIAEWLSHQESHVLKELNLKERARVITIVNTLQFQHEVIRGEFALSAALGMLAIGVALHSSILEALCLVPWGISFVYLRRSGKTEKKLNSQVYSAVYEDARIIQDEESRLSKEYEVLRELVEDETRKDEDSSPSNVTKS